MDTKARSFLAVGGAAVAVVAFMASACNDDAIRTEATDQSAKVFHIPESRRTEVLAAASEFERPLLEDGTLTFDEYERAVFAKLQCFRELGGTVYGDVMFHGGRIEGDGPDLSVRSRYYYSASLPADEDPIAIAACGARYANIVEFLWAEATAPTEQEIEEARAALIQCLAGNSGKTAPALDNRDEFDAFVEREEIAPIWWTCRVEIGLRFGMPGFAG